MNWLITGGCGFIGRALISRLLLSDKNRVRVIDNLSVGTRDDLGEVDDFVTYSSGMDAREWVSDLMLVEGDILDDELVKTVTIGADVVVHLAANTGVGPSVQDPKQDCLANVIGTLNVLEACRLSKVMRFVFASSGAPLGVQIPPLHESLAPHPASPYGASKLAGEGYCSAYYHCFGIETVALRFGNVYGEGSGHKQSVVAKFIKEAMENKVLEIYGDGNQTRDFIYISDLIDAIRLSAISEDVGGEVFQIASANETTILELVGLLLPQLEIEGIKTPSTYFGEKRVGDVMRNFSDTSKALKRLGWSPKVSLSDGLQKTVRYFKKHSKKQII